MFVIQLSRDNKRHNMLLSFKPSSSSLNRSDSIITIPDMLLTCGRTSKTQGKCRADDKGVYLENRGQLLRGPLYGHKPNNSCIPVACNLPGQQGKRDYNIHQIW